MNLLRVILGTNHIVLMEDNSLHLCYKCKEQKLLSDFYKNKRKGRQSFCKTCTKTCVRNKTPLKKRLPSNDIGRTCTKCLEFKPWDKFAKDHSCRNGYKSMCKICRNNYEVRIFHGNPERKLKQYSRSKLYNQNNPELVKMWRKKHQFSEHKRKGIDINHEKFEQLSESQNYRCAICGGVEIINGKTIRLSVDHCHKTNQVRGLLCGNCNRGIGLLKDDPELLIRAVAYLRKAVKKNEYDNN